MMKKEFFERGIEEIISQDSLEQRLKAGKLRIKYGVDPTRPDIHLGHAVAMRKLKELQDDGHTVIFLIGDYTTKIGDPSGRNSARPILSDDEIKENAKTYFEQAGKILDIDKAEIRYNSEWLSKLNFSDLLELTGKFTVAQIIERDDFAKRLSSGQDLGMHEILYPLMQAYDSVILKADVEVGGTDQRFNLLAGRDLQKKMGQKPQDIIIVDLLVGLDGSIKMSKSADNYISITETPNSMFGKVMSIPDDLILSYYELATELPLSEIDEIKTKIESGLNPRDIKLDLASEIVTIYHSSANATEAKAEFISRFSNKELPTDLPEITLVEKDIDLLSLINLIDKDMSNSDARRLIEQGGVRIDGTQVTDLHSKLSLKSGSTVQLGKLRAFRVK